MWVYFEGKCERRKAMQLYWERRYRFCSFPFCRNVPHIFPHFLDRKKLFFWMSEKKSFKSFFLFLLVLLVRPIFRHRRMSLQHLWQIFSLFLKQKQKNDFDKKTLETFSSSFSRMDKKEVEMTLTKTFSGFFNSPNINKLPFH